MNAYHTSIHIIQIAISNILMSSNSAKVIKFVADYLYRSFELQKQILSNSSI